MAQLNRITVTGAGVLGGQIAWHSAFKGKTVVVHDISANSLDNCRAAHDNYAGIYLADVGASESDIAATRARLALRRTGRRACSRRDCCARRSPPARSRSADTVRASPSCARAPRRRPPELP